MKTLPTFFIVGAARSGTTSLDRYLSQHPEIYVTPKKETHFFAADSFPSCSGPGDERLSTLLVQDEDQYAQLFVDAKGAKAIGESSAFYLCFPSAAQRIARTIPDAKIIITLREPVERLYSAYTFMVRDGRESLGLEEGLNREEERKRSGWEPIWWYREVSLYYQQVKYYLEVFGPQRVKIVLYNELFANPEQTLREVFAFLNVREDATINTSVRYNVSGVPKSRRFYNRLDKFIYNPNGLEKRVKSLIPRHLRVAWASKIIGMSVERVPLDARKQAQLKTYFAEDVGKLEDLLQRDLQSWRYQTPSMA